jgi:hypothetical protein
MREFAGPADDPPAAAGGDPAGEAGADADAGEGDDDDDDDDAGCDPPHAAAMTAEPRTAKRIRAR